LAGADSSTTLPNGGAPGWGIYEIALADDPYPEWARLRAASPVFDAGGGVFFVSSFALADQVVRSPALRAGGGVAASLPKPEGLDYDPMQLWLMALDGAEHDRARGLVRREFTAGAVARLTPAIEARAGELVTAFLERLREGPADFVGAVATRLPSDLICQLFGVAPEVWDEEVAPLFSPPGGEPGAAIGGLAAFFSQLQGRSHDGLLAKLQRPGADGSALTPEEVVSNAVLLVTAAVDTTTGLVANALLCVLEHDAIRAQLLEDAGSAAAIVEETLRFEPPALSCSRYAAREFELGGLEIPAGSHLLVGIGAANRDPDRYPSPDTFRLGRDLSGSLSFGGGQHFCLGAALARSEATAVLAALARSGELDRLERVGPVTWRKDNPTIRAPRELVVGAGL